MACRVAAGIGIRETRATSHKPQGKERVEWTKEKSPLIPLCERGKIGGFYYKKNTVIARSPISPSPLAGEGRGEGGIYLDETIQQRSLRAKRSNPLKTIARALKPDAASRGFPARKEPDMIAHPGGMRPRSGKRTK